MNENVASVIMAGGAGSRLWPLTENRAKPAVPIAGKFRLIDIPISNCINSGIRKMFVLTQFNSVSLNRHITHTYFFAPFSEGFVQILAAQQTPDSKNWYQGTADSVRQMFRYFNAKTYDYHLILAGDHLYSMDYSKLIEFHKEKGADITVGVLPVVKEQASGFGILKMNDKSIITDFIEKPKEDKELDPYHAPPDWMRKLGFDPDETPFIGSMGIYVFNRKVLEDVLTECEHEDFGKGVIPYAIRHKKVFGYLFDGYWEDIGTIGSFFQTMMDLVSPMPKFNFYESKRPIYTRPRYLPGAKVAGCHICRSIINEGAILEESFIEDSMIGIRGRIHTGAKVLHSVVMGADYYETAEDLEENLVLGRPAVGIGKDSVIERAIIDKNARLGDGVQILDRNRAEEVRESNYVIRDGIVIIPKNAIIPAGTIIG
ncbi:glucose-1-phosphate adenylyltransferase [candidate division KSB1 bacterium]|nr:glucose-1-phosphate adenylyltransferase [candidate division KSB1 bacterium]